jgi:hypothetical protein
LQDHLQIQLTWEFQPIFWKVSRAIYAFPVQSKARAAPTDNLMEIIVDD